MSERNEALERARAEYAAVEERYVRSLEDKGLKFVPRGQGEQRRAELRERLRERGVTFRNDGASLSYGWLSPACVECTGANGSETFSTTFACHRDCYFCFNRNQADYELFFEQGCPWEEGLERAAEEHESLAVIGLTGGEPLLNLDDSLAFLARAAELFPNAHKRMYTSGDLLTEEAAAALRDAGLDEIRFSVKDDDPVALQQKVLDAMRLAKRYIPHVMVEMPIIPGSREHVQNLMLAFQEVGIDGMNLLEFCFPFCHWEEFDKRGFQLRNPPFEVMYDYGYSGGLAVAGSEELILELMDWAIDNGITFGMHYCSLENKHRSEIRQKNERAAGMHPCIVFDEGNFFLCTAKAFGDDVVPVRAALDELGCDCYMEDEDEGSLTFPPALAPQVRAACPTVQLQDCLLVYELDDQGGYLTDVALR